MNNFHAKTKEEIFLSFKTSEKGLDRETANSRLKETGFNEIIKAKKIPEILIFLKQFNSSLIYILLVAMIISFAFQHLVDGYVILGTIFINAVISYVQERKAERAIEALKKMIVSYAKVLRENEILKIPTRELVPGDIIILEEGDKVPADARIFEAKNFRTQESSLTGESLPKEKSSKTLGENVPLGDRTNMVFMSSDVVSGTARAVVVATGKRTEIGKIAESIREIVQPKTHFHEKINFLTFEMALFAITGALLIFLIGFFIRGLAFFDIFLFTIASLVSAVPEGLPAVLTIVLAVGSRRMAKRNAIIRHLPAVETLGVATVIATDKTGTLTKNTLTVEKIITCEGEFDVTGNGWEPIGKFMKDKKSISFSSFPTLDKLLKISAISNNGTLLRKDGDYETLGDPTEVSFLVLSKKAGMDKKTLAEKEKIIDDLPFNSEIKFRATLANSEGKNQIYSIGAFETILKKSSYIMKRNSKIKFTAKEKGEFMNHALKMAEKGIRVLGLAYRDSMKTQNNISGDDVHSMIFVGLVGMRDPLRKESRDAVKKAGEAGIKVIMQTGDHEKTALAIAEEIGLISGKNKKVLTEDDLQKLSEEDFYDRVKSCSVFARVTPGMKLKIVQALQKHGDIVAMTGDGVNDAPALKKADIGVSMGIIGTDVARESSEMVLADDNFASIVNAIEEGRTVFNNVRKTSFYLVTTNVAEQVTILSSLLLFLPLPLLPIQVLYLNLVTDTFNGIGLSLEPGHTGVLKRPPKDRKENILNKELGFYLVVMSGLMVFGTIPLFIYFLPHGIDKARTVAFVAMTLFQWFNAINLRSLGKSIFEIGMFTNKYLVYTLVVSLALMLFVIYIPFMAKIFDFIPLSFVEIGIITLIASSILFLGEIYKRFRGHKHY